MVEEVGYNHPCVVAPAIAEDAAMAGETACAVASPYRPLAIPRYFFSCVLGGGGGGETYPFSSVSFGLVGGAGTCLFSDSAIDSSLNRRLQERTTLDISHHQRETEQRLD